MGLTVSSGGRFLVKSRHIPDGTFCVAMVGNPNVGKSSLFNSLTGLHQHTGNWTGKTVECSFGMLRKRKRNRGMTSDRKEKIDYTFTASLPTVFLADLPGCYSLVPRTAEEEAALDFLTTRPLSGAVVVCDGLNLERNLLLAFQLTHILPKERIVLCINLIDEAEKAGYLIDHDALTKTSGFTVVLTSARTGRGVDELRSAIYALSQKHDELFASDSRTKTEIPSASAYIDMAKACVASCLKSRVSRDVEEKSGDKVEVKGKQSREGTGKRRAKGKKGLLLDNIIMGKYTAIPAALLFLALILWITIYGANKPSEWLARLLDWVGDKLWSIPIWARLPRWVSGILIDGVYTTTARVTSVMLPPMAIFFPLFTLLEDFGFLPRIAFNFDRCFNACRACGKQALTMCMGLGCCAAGVTGCRIIDSPRERKIAILTNSLMPCNGKFPTLLAMSAICLIFSGKTGDGAPSIGISLLSAVMITGMIILCIGVTMLASRLLSATFLKGTASSFVLEIPPYRVPNIPQVLIRSILDRTLFVLGRALSVAAPAGALLWLLTNIDVGGSIGNSVAGNGNLLSALSTFLNPVGMLLCVDGVVLLALILSLPANELTVPILLMIYTSGSQMVEGFTSSQMRFILGDVGWSIWEVLGFLILFLFHSPCATTLMTIHKETGKMRWVFLSILLPTVVGICLCLLLRLIRAVF